MASLTPPKPQKVEQPSPASLPELHRKVIDAQVTRGRLNRAGAGGVELFFARMDLVLSRFNTLRLVRVFQLYGQRRGPLMAAGLAYRLFFAIAALLVVAISILGIVVAGNVRLQDLVVTAVDATVPGLIGNPDDGDGIVSSDDLFGGAAPFGFALVIAVVVMLTTSLGWVSGMREAMRGIFDLPPLPGIFLLIKLKDLGTLAVLGVVMLVTTVLGILANNTLGALLGLLNLSAVSQVLTQIAGFTVMTVLDVLVAMVLLRSASGIGMPRPFLLQGAVIAGVGSTLLRTFSALLLGSVTSNPLLLPFAVILALFVWFFFLSQVYLLATAWCAVGAADATLEADRLQQVRGGTLEQRSRRKAQSS